MRQWRLPASTGTDLGLHLAQRAAIGQIEIGRAITAPKPGFPLLRTCPRCGGDAKLWNVLPPIGRSRSYGALYRCDDCNFVRKEG